MCLGCSFAPFRPCFSSDCLLSIISFNQKAGQGDWFYPVTLSGMPASDEDYKTLSLRYILSYNFTYSVLCCKQTFLVALLYITTITRVVSISDKHNASQMPFVPIAWGKRMKEGIKKINPRNRARKVAGFTRSTL